MKPNGDTVTFDLWRLKGDEDFASAMILSAHGGPSATICFLCQQMAEKYLKGYLLLRGRPLRRIHQLDALLEDTIILDESFRVLVDAAVFLKRYYTVSRYPDDIPEDVTPDEAATALASATRVRDFVLAKLGRRR
jgi:HEPN domain-containing protein